MLVIQAMFEIQLFITIYKILYVAWQAWKKENLNAITVIDNAA